MGKKLSRAQVDHFQSKGYFAPVDAFSVDQAAFYAKEFQKVQALQPRYPDMNFNFKLNLLFKWADQVVHHPAILDAVEDLIGPDIRLFHSTVFLKKPNDLAFIGWHQDATYFGLEPPEQVTAWIALTDASIEAGCMEVTVGSHKLGQLRHGQFKTAHNLLSKGQTVTVDFDHSNTEFMPVHPGQFSLHHTYLVHQSGPNRTAHPRVGMGLSYIPTRARCIGSMRLSAMLVRGVDRYGHFDDEPRPTVDCGAAERAVHTESVARFKTSNDEQATKY